ncbi:hypothetical protein [Spiroplasma gladiatoris]|uniref:hypothetical protein n=1 Tax=Spiroplasma gladiatoris TaxID=2143 RepID=UPI001419E314|nr:hypothetical protein [Spiroplasma gladiatoris]
MATIKLTEIDLCIKKMSYELHIYRLTKIFAYLSVIKDANTGFIVGHKVSL